MVQWMVSVLDDCFFQEGPDSVELAFPRLILIRHLPLVVDSLAFRNGLFSTAL